MTFRTVVTVLFVALADVGSIAAQEPAEVTAGYERRIDRFTWRFENPSSFDTPEPVPHAFRQHYEGDNHWALVRIRYGREGWRSETQFGATPQITTYGDDVDTFFQPTGDVVTSGTTGNVSMQSWRIDHRTEMWRKGRLRIDGGYRYRRDRARFHLGHKFVTHTLPPSREDSIVTTRETTWSETHEVRLVGEVSTRAPRWRLSWRIDAAPILLGRLTVQLPDKYPGVDLHFRAACASAGTEIALSRVPGPLAFELAAGYAQTGSYRSSASLVRRAVSLAARIGWKG